MGPLTLSFIDTGAVAGTTNTFTTTAASVCAIKGKFATPLAILTNSATTPTTDANTGVAFPAILQNTCAAVVFGINTAGTLSACQGPATPTNPGVTTTVGDFLLAPQFPELPDDFCPLAYTLVRVSPTGASFTLGTTNWAASGITCSVFTRVSTMPGRPQTT